VYVTLLLNHLFYLCTIFTITCNLFHSWQNCCWHWMYANLVLMMKWDSNRFPTYEANLKPSTKTKEKQMQFYAMKYRIFQRLIGLDIGGTVSIYMVILHFSRIFEWYLVFYFHSLILPWSHRVFPHLLPCHADRWTERKKGPLYISSYKYWNESIFIMYRTSRA